MKTRTLIDLKKKTSRTFDKSLMSWYEVYPNQDGTILAIVGLTPPYGYGECVCVFYDLTGDEIVKMESPQHSVYWGNGEPAFGHSAQTSLEWLPDGRLVWTEHCSYYVDMKMWYWEAESQIESLFPVPSEIGSPEWNRIVDEMFQRKQQEKKEWRIHKTIILKREGNKMVSS